MTIEKTICLYDANAYATEFDATVLSCEEAPKSETGENTHTYNLILDQTLFFPEQGGQSPDKGNINGIQVSDVQINDGECLSGRLRSKPAALHNPAYTRPRFLIF